MGAISEIRFEFFPNRAQSYVKSWLIRFLLMTNKCCERTFPPLFTTSSGICFDNFKDNKKFISPFRRVEIEIDERFTGPFPKPIAHQTDLWKNFYDPLTFTISSRNIPRIPHRNFRLSIIIAMNYRFRSGWSRQTKIFIELSILFPFPCVSDAVRLFACGW